MRFTNFFVTFTILLATSNHGSCQNRPIYDPLDYCRTRGYNSHGYITVAIKHAVDGRCMDVYDKQTGPDARIILYDCYREENGDLPWNQVFEALAGNKRQSVRFRAYYEGTSNCIYTGGGLNDPLYTISCHRDIQAHMSWRFFYGAANGPHQEKIMIKQDANGRCLRPDPNDASGLGIIEVECNERDEMQRWVICNPFDQNCR